MWKLFEWIFVRSIECQIYYFICKYMRKELNYLEMNSIGLCSLRKFMIWTMKIWIKRINRLIGNKLEHISIADHFVKEWCKIFEWILYAPLHVRFTTSFVIVWAIQNYRTKNLVGPQYYKAFDFFTLKVNHIFPALTYCFF